MTLAGRVSPFGHPRIKAWLPTPLGFSQVTDVLHRLSTPRHPPYALNNLIASTRRRWLLRLAPMCGNETVQQNRLDTPCRRTISPDNRASILRLISAAFSGLSIKLNKSLDEFSLLIFAITDQVLLWRDPRWNNERARSIGLDRD